ncbi:MAG TPA: NAD(P)/FAD-dependent oxidoreductase [Solimonas sp.]|nr:NAD(P)/FAD-dependent oxidoreductase [Solimonas sp.]
MERIGRRYRKGRAQSHYDVIVVGSGIGGLSTAALLSKLGRRVCVLEQHYTAGGFTHSYERNGYEWDVGVHYIGDVGHPNTMLRRLFDVCSEGALQWAPMDPAYDRIIVGDRSYDFVAGRDNFAASLKQQFPDEAEAIDRYVALVLKVARSAQTFFAGQAMPPLLGKAYRHLRPLLVPRESLMTVREVLESLTSNQELIGVLTGQWGDYGMVPAQASFLIHATVAKHYFNGGFYPVGGSWKIAETILPVIRASGGEVFTYARVKQILVENGRAVGVKLEDGEELRADNVVSSVGARMTFGELLPEASRKTLGYVADLKAAKPSGSSLCLFLGFKGTAQELKLPKTNLWIYPTPHHEQNVNRFQKDREADFPLLYVSFPSAKDPEWSKHYPDRSTVQVITMAPYEWFEQWRGSTWNQRGGEYEAFKAQLTQRMLAELYKQMPQLEGALDFHELATPLSTEWFHLYDRGEIYGLDHDPARFRQDWLQPATRLKGLYLTGQDVVTAGVGGALVGGMLTTSAMLGREAPKLMRMIKGWKPGEQVQAAVPEPA